MEITVISIVLGVVIAAACIGLPQLVRILTTQPDDNSRAYLEQTGRSPMDVAQNNAALLVQNETAARRGKQSG